METTVARRTFIGSTIAGIVAGTAASPLLALAQDEAKEEKLPKVESANGGASTPDGTPVHRWQSVAGATWRTAPESYADELIADGGTFDVVVVGGGQSGTWTAKSCAENGLSVAVIEQQPEESMQYVGGEVGTINCPWALEHGADEIDGQVFIREIFRRNAGRSNQRFIKDYVEHSGTILQGVIEEMGAEWVSANSHVGSCPHDERMVMDPSDYRFFTGTVIFRPDDMRREAWAWNDVMHRMNQDAQDAGAVWTWEHHAEYLEKDADGRVCAVIAQNVNDGTIQRLSATKAVVLCGGDYNGNLDMLRDLNDEYRYLAESMGDIELANPMPIFYPRDGSAIAMGVWAGGHPEVGPHAGMNTGQGSLGTPWGPGALSLNQNGKRFCDECAGGTEGAGYLVPRQPAGYVVSISDANWQDLVYAMPPAHGAIDIAHGNNWPMLVETLSQIKPGDAPGTCNNQDDTWEVFCANTIEELIDMLDVYTDEQKACALEEIARYQQYAANGCDEDFAKDPRILAVTKLDTPPYYGVKASNTGGLSAGLCQTNGLDVDSDHHVIDSTRNPIPGLFALGNTSGNRFIVQYATPLSGMSLGYCMTEGTLFGQRLASGEIS